MTRPRRESSGGRPRSPSRHNRYQAPSTLTSAGWSPSPSITKSSIPVSNHSFFPYTDTADDSVASKSCLSLRLTPRSRWSLRSRGSNSSRSTSQSDPERRVSRQRNNRLQLDQPTVLRDKASQRWQAFPSAPSANITAVSTSDDSANPSPTNRHENSKIVPNASKDTVQQSKPTIGTPNTQDNNNNGNLVSERTLSLLTPPTPSDRTERFRGTSYAEPQILSQSQQPVRRGLYQGELEPHGVRGQQAPVVAPATTPTLPDGMPGLRSFERTHTFHANNATHRNRHSASYSEATREDRPQGERNEESHLQFSPTTGQVLSSSPAAIPVAIVEESEDCSTDSDTELQKLKDAFLADVRAPSPLEFQRSQELQSSSRQASQFSSQEPQSQTPTQPATASPVTGPPEALSLHTAEVDILNTQAMKSVQEQDYNRALGIFTEVLDIHRQQNGLSHATVASAYHNLGTVHARRAGTFPDNSLSQQNSRQEALNCFQAAARTARDALGPNHPNVAVSLVRIGFLLLQSKEYQSAVITFREALRVRIAHYGATHGLVANLYNNLGVCEMHLEKFPVGLEYLESALQIQRNAVDAGMPPEHRQATRLELADTLFNIGGLCLEWIRRQGPDVRRATEAEHAFEEALKIRRDVLGPDDPLVHQVQVLLEMARSVPRPRKGLTSHVLSPNRSRTPIRRAFDDKPTAIHETAVVGMETAIQPTKPFRHSASNNREVSLLSLHSCNQLGEHVQSFSPSRPQASRPFDEARGCVKDVQLDAWKELLPNDETYGKSIGRTMTPMLEAKVSQDQEEDGGTEDIRGERNFPIPPHFITKHLASESLHKSKSCFSTKTDRRSLHENLKAHDSQKVNLGGISVPMNMSYDGDENCLISDTGVDSEHGRIHYPVTWNKAGIVANEITENPKRRDIIAARSFPSAKVASEILMRPNGSSGKDSEEAKYDFERDVLTGNKERDNVMARVRAVLSAHAQDESTEDTSDIQRAAQNNFRGASVLEQDLMEDGIAPLEGNWPSSNGSASARQMLQDPMNNLFDIHIKASSLLKKNNNVEALRLFKVVLQCQRQRNGPIHMGVGAALHNVGIAELRAQNHEGALRYFEEAARVRKGALGRDHPLVAVTMVKVGISLLLLHRFEEALRSFREALSIRKHALGALHPSTARIYNNIGCVYVEFNEFREACLAFESALDIQRNSLSHDADSGPLIFATATTLCNLGYLYRYRDMYTKAASVLKEAASLQESVLGRSHASVLSTLDNLADSCANSGQADDALKYYDMVLERFRAGGKVRSPKVLRAEAVLLYKMSRVHKQNNDFEAQLDILKLALRAICAYSDATPGNRTDTLERRIEYDANACREELQKNGFDRI